MNEGAARALELLIAPAVIIPACGLLVLSISARLNAVIGRIRAMHTELIDVFLHDTDTNARWQAVREMRLAGLERQTGRMLFRCRLMQHEIRLLYGAVILLAVVSVLLGLSVYHPQLQVTAAYVFGFGMLSVLLAMAVAVWEISLALEAVSFEHRRVLELCESSADLTGGAP